MEIKEILEKPFTDDQQIDFIIRNTQVLHYEIQETDEELQAWGLDAEEEAEKEKERIAHLSLTKREVFLALYKDKKITPEQIKAQITNPEALIEFEYATDYFRGNPLINSIGAKLGYTPEQLDYLFINGEFEDESSTDISAD